MSIQHAEQYVESLNDERDTREGTESIEARYAIRWTLWKLDRGRNPENYRQYLPAKRRRVIRERVEQELAR